METSLFSHRLIPKYQINLDITTRYALRSRYVSLLKNVRCLYLCDSYCLRDIRTNAHVRAIFASLGYLRRFLESGIPRRIRFAITGTGNFRGAYASKLDEKFIAARRMYVVVAYTWYVDVLIPCKNETYYARRRLETYCYRY